jgi:hypothetical protein
MLAEQKKAAVFAETKATASKDTIKPKDYPSDGAESSQKRARQISERLAQMPRAYRGIYERAVAGKSRKAAMHAFCNECCGWQIKEVFLCIDLGCPLYPYRPKSRVSPEAHKSVPICEESKNSGQGIAE